MNGTAYNIKKGRTLIEGTGYDISFVPWTTVTVNKIDFSWNLDTFYIRVNRGKNMEGAETETVKVDPGVSASMKIYGSKLSGYSRYRLYFNGVEDNRVGYTSLNRTVDVTGKRVTVQIDREGRYGTNTYYIYVSWD